MNNEYDWVLFSQISFVVIWRISEIITDTRAIRPFTKLIIENWTKYLKVYLMHHLHINLESCCEALHAFKARLCNLCVAALERLVQHREDLVSAFWDVVTGGESPQSRLPKGHQVGHIFVAWKLLKVGIILFAES